MAIRLQAVEYMLLADEYEASQAVPERAVFATCATAMRDAMMAAIDRFAEKQQPDVTVLTLSSFKPLVCKCGCEED
jgi:hypothetical protein